MIKALVKNLINAQDRIFLAGAEGMAGSAIYRSLIKHGFKNILKPSRKELDLLNINLVQRWFEEEKPDVVILAAAKVGGISANNKFPAAFLLDNLKIQTNVIETAWKSKVRRLLFLGSSCIYPKFSKQPIREEELLSGPLEQTNKWYALAKIAGINLCAALRKQYGFDAICLMPTNLYGPGDNYNLENSHVLPALIRKFCDAVEQKKNNVNCWGTGSPLREFLHSEDLGEACVFALMNWLPEIQNIFQNNNDDPLIYLNVGTGKDISIKELAEKISVLTNYKGSITWDTSKPDGTPKKQLDVSRIESLGWKAKIALDEGLKLAINSYKLEKIENDLRE